VDETILTLQPTTIERF